MSTFGKGGGITKDKLILFLCGYGVIDKFENIGTMKGSPILKAIQLKSTPDFFTERTLIDKINMLDPSV